MEKYAGHHPLNRRNLFFDVGKRLGEKGHLDYSYKCYIAGNYIGEGLDAMNRLVQALCCRSLCETLSQITGRLSEMLIEKLTGRGDRFIQNRNHVAVLFDQMRSIQIDVPSRNQLHEGNGRSFVEEAAELEKVFIMIQSYHCKSFGDVVHRFERLPFIPREENDLQECVQKLNTQFPLILDILHQLFGLFCRALVVEVETQPHERRDQRDAQIGRYQQFAMLLPNEYNFKAQIGRELAQASSQLATI